MGSAVLLIIGSPLLTFSLDNSENVPLGTFTTWAGIICLPLTVYLGVQEFRNPKSKVDKSLALLLKVILWLAVFWAPISYLLAGNWSFSFNGYSSIQGGQIAMKIFWILSYSLAIIPIALLLVSWFIKYFVNRNS